METIVKNTEFLIDSPFGNFTIQEGLEVLIINFFALILEIRTGVLKKYFLQTK